MPQRVPRICSCGKVVPSGQKCSCQKARQVAFDKERGSAAERGYDSAWRALRLKFLKMHPDCSEPGCCRPANEVDHIISVRDRPDLRLAWKNLRPFCKPHHSARTARDQSFGRSTR